MALTTLERQRLRAALNNISLANRIETMLNYVDTLSHPDSFHQAMKPSSLIATDGFVDLAPVFVEEAAAISIDLDTLSQASSGTSLVWQLDDDPMSLGATVDSATGLFTGTAPAFGGGGPGGSYPLQFTFSTPYGAIGVMALVFVTEAP